MPTSEQEFLAQIASAEREISEQKVNMTWYKRRVSETESRLIEVKIRKERLIESLDRLRASTISAEITDREKDISGFKLRHPKLCQMAEDRDKAAVK